MSFSTGWPFSTTTRAFRRFMAGEPMKSATKRFAGVFVDLRRRADLLQDAVLQHGDLGGQRHGLDLVVRDVDDGSCRSSRAGA